ncbi:MAG: hypothetical protein FRX49_04011 [Trebouxia sp. A1-2]|nr:MAG: hypothetical protein FRX49_04011 [Trebouxia sp. A1-2]
MSSPAAIAAAEPGMQEAAVVPGAGSPAGVVLPKLPSWGASGWQALFKQTSAGAADLTDMLTEPGGEDLQALYSAQLGGEAGASPLFKWTSDGSMMEELMKAYKDSSPGTPTFGGGAQGNSIFRDGSLMRDGSLFKDGSITSCLQAAFQAQMEEEEQQGLQEGGQAGASVTPQQAAPPSQATVEQTPANPAPFTFKAVGADTSDSPQLHVPELQLGPQLGQDLRQSPGSQLQLPGPAELGSPLGNQTESYGAVPRTVITSGAMGGDVWTRPNSRPVSPGNQRQAAYFGAAAQVVNPDGSVQSVPRIVIRTSAPMTQPEQSKQGSPPQPSQQPVVLNTAQAAFRSSSGFLIPPPVGQTPVGQLFQPADGPYNTAVQSLEQRAHSVSSQSGSYQSGHTSHESTAVNAAQSQHPAIPSVGLHQGQEQSKQQQSMAAHSQHSYQAVYQQQQQHQLPASTQAGGVVSQKPGGLVWRGIPGPTGAPGTPVAAASGPIMGAGFSGMQQQPSQQMPGRATGTAEPQSSISHGTVLLTSKPVTSSEATITGKVVSFAPEPAQEQQQNVMPSIPGVSDSAGSAKENIQDQASQQAPPPQPGRKFKRDRSSRKNSFSLPPVPPKKQASAAVEFSPATSLEFVLHGAASAPLTLEAQGFPAELAAANMRHSASAQDMVTDTSSGDLPAGAAASEALCGDKSSRSSSADVIFCADGIDFNSRAWKMMSRKEKNRASAAASRARREAYTESLEHKANKPNHSTSRADTNMDQPENGQEPTEISADKLAADETEKEDEMGDKTS